MNATAVSHESSARWGEPVLPVEWKRKKLDELSAKLITYGIVQPGPHIPTGVPFIQTRDLEAHALDIQAMDRTSQQIHTAYARSAVYPGDIVIGIRASVGEVAYVPAELEEANISRGVARITPNETADARYLFWALRGPIVVSNISKSVKGSTYAEITLPALRSVEVPIPPTEHEQRAIATALSDVDELIGALDKLIAKKRAIKLATMQQLLTGKTRLPGFNGEWREDRLEYVVDCLDNLRVPLNEAQRAKMPGPYPYCGANGVLDHVNDYVVDDDVILIAEDGGYFDEFATRPIAYRMRGKIWVNNHAHILKAKDGMSQGYVFFTLVHKNILPYLASGTRAKLNKGEMNKIEVRFPVDVREQELIGAILSDMDAEIVALEQRRDKAKAIKQGMMQSLLTGRVRLVEPEGAT